MTLSLSVLAEANKLGQRLTEKGLKVTCAESCTGGGIGYALTSTAGSSAWFEQGFITYSNQAKMAMLDVSPVTLAQHGAVSQEVVKQMAQGAARHAAAEIAVAVSGIAGPDGGSQQKPVGLVWFGFYQAGQVTAMEKKLSGDRHQVREQAIEFALQHINSLLDTN